MKKWMIVAAILICCVLYALVKFSKPQGRNETNQVEESRIEVQADAGDANKAPLAESSGSTVPAEQVEAIVKVFGEFQSAMKSEDFENAWKLTSEFFKSRVSFEEFKKVPPGLEDATVDPESAINIAGSVGLLVTIPPHKEGIYLLFNQEDGQWKLHDERSVKSVNTSKE